MYIITNKDNVIVHISETIGYQENGNVLVDNDTLAIPKISVDKIYEVETIETGIVEQKYCYTEEEGFYRNVNYKEHISIEDRVSALEDMMNMQLGF